MLIKCANSTENQCYELITHYNLHAKTTTQVKFSKKSDNLVNITKYKMKLVLKNFDMLIKCVYNLRLT